MLTLNHFKDCTNTFSLVATLIYSFDKGLSFLLGETFLSISKTQIILLDSDNIYG